MGYKFEYKKFRNINLEDSFFDSLKRDYEGFEGWFERKADDYAYIQSMDGIIKGFLYLKVEEGPITDVSPAIEFDRVVKIGTMKIDAHGTRLGERFIKKSVDFAIKNGINYVYVTVFEKHRGLINLYEKYGFRQYAQKTTNDGTEIVLLKDIQLYDEDPRKCYPKLNLNSNAYLLAIKPIYHTKLFPDSILSNESIDIVEDISHTNSIEKIYICRMEGVSNLRQGDLLLIYRTTDYRGPALYRSVSTSICVVDEVRSNKSFVNFDEYKSYCKNYSVFTEDYLRESYYSHVEHFAIKMTYNASLTRKITRKSLIEDIGLHSDYWGFFRITRSQIENVLSMGSVNDGYIIR